ncbi:hypothetical protein [Acinetobacter larvae]|uniref:Immunity protein 52 domain-containing protein n=1 Tax=Acinetobacter larvae TaxID=1789224 RepID=A0A1B2LWQ1_9GAMM|nr:hypothetical protein [Acinetobacter larvae]AOA57319.1 hypothetical protein BFG52_02405 [Acinetobacter larvae]
MSEFFLNTRFYKRLPCEEKNINEQLFLLKRIIENLVLVNPVFSKWYVNNPTNKKTLFEYPFPSQKADHYLLNLRKKDIFQSFSLWNGEDNSNFASIIFTTFDIRMTFEKVIDWQEVVQIFRIILDYLRVQYIYVSSDFIADTNIFPHRLVTTPICYIPQKIEANELAYLYQQINITNQYNQGSILVFDENWFIETASLKKKIQENALALVELGLIPTTELPDNFFEQ